MFFRTYVLLIQSTDAGCSLWPYLSPILICLKIKNPSLYQKYVNNTCSVSEVIEEIVPADKIDIERFDCELFIAVIYASFWAEGYPTKAGKSLKQFIQEMKEGRESGETNFLPSYLKENKDYFKKSIIPKIEDLHKDSPFKQEYNYGVLQSIAKKIDFIASGSFPD